MIIIAHLFFLLSSRAETGRKTHAVVRTRVGVVTHFREDRKIDSSKRPDLIKLLKGGIKAEIKENLKTICSTGNVTAFHATRLSISVPYELFKVMSVFFFFFRGGD